MERSGIKYCNSYYTRSPTAVLKIAELIFGAGAWGPIILVPVNTSGPFSFFLWSTFSSWILVLLSYLLGLCQLSVRPQSEADWTRYYAPSLEDLCMNAVIALVYIPSIIVFGVYWFPLDAFSTNSSGVFVIIMAIITFVLHAFHASPLVLYFTLGESRWEAERRWIWQKNVGPATQIRGADERKTQAPTGSGYENQSPVIEQTPATDQAHAEIYQDVR